MPSEFRIVPGLRTVFTRGSGVLTYEEVLRHMLSLPAHPDFRPDFNELIDAREAATVHLTAEQVRTLAARPLYNLDVRRAYVTGSDLQYGLVRMFGVFRESVGDFGIRVFRRMDDAREWLGLKPEDLPVWDK
jgi:hypothetical protein